jgi:hypothetical protein
MCGALLRGRNPRRQPSGRCMYPVPEAAASRAPVALSVRGNDKSDDPVHVRLLSRENRSTCLSIRTWAMPSRAVCAELEVGWISNLIADTAHIELVTPC